HYDLREAGFEVGDRIEIEVLPLIAWDVGPRDDDCIEWDVVCCEHGWWPTEGVLSRSEKRQTIVVGDLDVRRHESGRGEQRQHVAIQVRRPDSHRKRPLDLRAELALHLYEIRFRRDRVIVARERAGGIEQTRH